MLRFRRADRRVLEITAELCDWGRRRMMFGEFHRVCAVADVILDRGVSVMVGDVAIAIINDGGTIRAVSGRCPHAGGLLGRGWVEEGSLVCPLHRWHFRLRDGRCQTVRGEFVELFPCEIREGEVFVRV